MKTRFNTYDIICGVTELQKLVGLRVNQIYDIDNKTYLIRFQQGETKFVLLLESGIRFHTTGFEWPKNVAPSGFSMKLRKHLKNKRLEKFSQLGVDRIVDLQFGMNEAAYHIIIELYDRGNVILTDHEMTILYILRPHYEGEEVRFAMREKYPLNRAKAASDEFNDEFIRKILTAANPGDNLRRILVPVLDCGAAVIDHVLTKHSLINCVIGGSDEETKDSQDPQSSTQEQGKKNRKNKKNKDSGSSRVFDSPKDLPTLKLAIAEVVSILEEARNTIRKGYIVQKKELKPSEDGKSEEFFLQNIEYHPMSFTQFKDDPQQEFPTFMQAVDEFFSTLEGQKIDLKTLHQEREALKKLSNVKKDHSKRLEDLTKVQEVDKIKAELIIRNQAQVENAIIAIQTAIANQMSWDNIREFIKVHQKNGDPIAMMVKELKLNVNKISLNLSDPYKTLYGEDSDNENENLSALPSMVVDINLGLSAMANSCKYYDQKRNAAKKEQKTIDASQKALKSAERKTQQTLKDVRTISTITKARKVYWFEKFYWFISSENFLIIGGRDAQQNELIVKRYMRPSDIYVHAEIQGAASVIIRNPSDKEVPPKTLLEAGTMAISYSVAWDAKVVTNAYWVKSEQVSKTAPTGEYLGTGSFMVRGKKNFLPPCHLIMGLSLLFKLEDGSIDRHRGERKVRTFDDGLESGMNEIIIENEKLNSVAEEEEINLDDIDTVEPSNPDEPIVEIEYKNDDLEKDPSVDPEEHNSDSCEEDESPLFPDTQVKIEHDTGKVIIENKTKLDLNNVVSDLEISKAVNDDETPVIIKAVIPRKKQQQNAKKRKEERAQRKADNEQSRYNEGAKKQTNELNRGQRRKLKKLKDKYKDQDEDEKQYRMNILNPSNKMKKVEDNSNLEENITQNKHPKQKFENKNAAVEDFDDVPVNADVDMLESLTGFALDEDELLFAIPVIAPYQSLQNYKFKVKLTPGTGKRGKAAKTALMMFSKDKSCSSREKDLLKGIKEESLARNIPGKVKLSAPQLQKYKK